MHTTPRRIAQTLATTATAAALTWLPVPAHAAPGDAGDVKIHTTTEAVGDQADEPKVCGFYLDAFTFDTVTAAVWTIEQQPPTGTAEVLNGSILLAGGIGHTGHLSLPDGHYKLDWYPVGAPGSAKHKVFTVDCASGSPSPSGSSSPSTGGGPSGSPSGGPSGAPSGGPSGGPSQRPGSGRTPNGPVGAGEGGASGSSGRAEIAGGAALVAAAGALLARARRRARRHADH
ncbi:hypothetical protein [Kitasatospora viridis]|uniref:LPXTG-motif cell wall-anchored protein n=1 Tax=Kitasatospora viridis TaxID=281105 RepID=A0A561S971_9ACTN|nr:hypothetical protein [Kitasatospora viridis]TWF71419.1 hypothetical protein FHX73_1949 [Kitasatospora viridis]